MKTNFTLSKQPIDYQISIHVLNLSRSFIMDKIIDNIKYILESKEQEIVLDTFLDMHSEDLCAFRCAQIVQHYSAKKVMNFIKTVHPEAKVS